MRVSDVISNVTKQNKTWTSWRQGTKLRVRLSLANARFASLLSKVMYIIKRKFKCLSWIWLLFHLVKWKNVYFIRAFGTHEIYIFFTSLDEIKVIFTPNIWISSIYFMTGQTFCVFGAKSGSLSFDGIFIWIVHATITKIRLFKYIENFTTKKGKLSDKKIWYFSYFCLKHRL